MGGLWEPSKNMGSFVESQCLLFSTVEHRLSKERERKLDRLRGLLPETKFAEYFIKDFFVGGFTCDFAEGLQSAIKI